MPSQSCQNSKTSRQFFEALYDLKEQYLTPAMFHNCIRDHLDQCEPVGIGLAKFKVTEVILRGKHGVIKKVFPGPEPYMM